MRWSQNRKLLVYHCLIVTRAAANWSAQRVLDKMPEFDSLNGDKGPVMFTIEMITKSMFEDYESLRATKEVAELLAESPNWPDLYDEEQLAKNEVPVYSATYFDDLDVNFDFSQETAKKIKGCKMFITNTMFHDALRAKSDEVMKELFAMRDDVRY